MIDLKPLYLSERPGLIAGILALSLLAVMIANSPSNRCYDETFHLNLAQDVLERGWSVASTSPNNQSAAGPLYSAVHLFALQAIRIEAPAVRFVNYFFLVSVIVTLAYSARDGSSKLAWLAGFSVVSVPFAWPCAGLALTELPALAAFSLFVLAMLHILRVEETDSLFRMCGWAAAAGLLLGLSVLGRQTYLVVVPVVGFMCFLIPRKAPLLLLCLTVAAIACGWLFMLWGGLVPPALARVDGGLRLEYGALSLSYVAAATLFLQPRWLRPPSGGVSLGALGLGIVFALLCRDYTNPPAKSLLIGVFGERAGLAFGFMVNSLFMTAGILWAWTALQRCWQARRDPLRVFLFLTLFVLVAAPMKVSHTFSSRYLVGLLGVLVLVLEIPSNTACRWYAVRMSVGSVLGAAILWTYYR